MIRKILTLTALVFAAVSASALANAPNPTSTRVDNVVHNANGSVTVTISGTWNWDATNGAQTDCNDQRIGVGYAVSWGDNQDNAIAAKGNSPAVYVGDAQDNWVHSVSQDRESKTASSGGVNMTFDGPFKSGSGTVTETMSGQTPDAAANGFGPQGISSGASSASPSSTDASHWYSNCGPTQQSVVNGVTIGNSNPSNPTQGIPAGQWGPISHTYSSSGPYTICPVMYDPHGHQVGDSAGTDAKQITAGGANRNGDNSVEANGLTNACAQFQIIIPNLTTQATPATATVGQTQAGDSAMLDNGSSSVKPSGTITWNLYGPYSSSSAISSSSCTGTPVDTTSTTVSGNGTYNTPSTGAYTPTAPGVYQWVASFAPDAGDKSDVAVGPVGCGDTSEQLTASVAPDSELTLVKAQRDATTGTPAGGAYTSNPITGAVGDTIQYQMTVTNSGNQPLALTLNDPHCDSGTVQGPTLVSGSLSGSTLAPGSVAVYVCSHALQAIDAPSFTNTATATGQPPEGTPVTTPPSSVVVNIPPATTPPHPGFTVVKEQKLSDQPASAYTSAPIAASVGSTIDYEILVANTGDQPLALTTFSDPHCDAGTLNGPAGGLDASGDLAVGQTTTYTCMHKVAAVDVPAFTNVAAVTATPPGGPPIGPVQSSVVANIPQQAVEACTVTKATLHSLGLNGNRPFIARVSGTQIKSVTFYLDGKKIKTLTAPNAAGGYQVKVNPKKLRVGTHRLLARIVATCGAPQQASLPFRHAPARRVITPHFTG